MMRRALRGWLRAAAALAWLVPALPISCNDNTSPGLDLYTPGLSPRPSPGGFVNPMDPLISNGNH
jgi:hypothetical protein